MEQFKTRIKYLLLLVVSVMVAVTINSCESDANHRHLDAVGNLMRVYPDSAYKIMQRIDPRSLSSDEENALYALRKVQADYFSDKPEWANDSTVSVALEYYRKNPEKPEAGQAFYMAGLVNRELDNKALAIENFTEAIISADTTDDVLTSARAHSELSHIYFSGKMLGLYLKHAREYYRKINLYKGPRATGYRNFALSQLSSAYYNIHNWDSTFHYINLGLNTIQRSEDPDNYYFLLLLKAKSLTLLDRYREALQIFNTIQSEYPDALDEISLIYIGNLHLKFKNIEKAEEYNSLLTSGHGKSNVLAANIAAQKGEYSKAYDILAEEYLKEFDRTLKISTDSIRTDNDIFAKIRDRRYHEKKERELNNKNIIGILIIVVILLCLLISVYMWHIRRRTLKRMESTITELSRDLELSQIYLESSRRDLESSRKEVTKINNELLNISIDKVSDYFNRIQRETHRGKKDGNNNDKHLSRVMELTIESFRNEDTIHQLEEIADRKTGGLLSFFKQTATSKLFHMTETLTFLILDYKPSVIADYLQKDSRKITRHRNNLKQRLMKEDPELYNRLCNYIKGWDKTPF